MVGFLGADIDCLRTMALDEFKNLANQTVLFQKRRTGDFLPLLDLHR